MRETGSVPSISGTRHRSALHPPRAVLPGRLTLPPPPSPPRKPLAKERRDVGCMRGRCPVYTYYLLLRTSETRYYWITFLIRPLFPLRETEKAKARKASERVEDRKLPPLPPSATSFSAAPPPPPLPAPTRGCLCVCPGAFSLLLAHPPPPEQRPPPFLFPRAGVFSSAGRSESRATRPAGPPRGVSSTFVFRMELLCRRFHLLYMRASAPARRYKRAHFRLG